MPKGWFCPGRAYPPDRCAAIGEWLGEISLRGLPRSASAFSRPWFAVVMSHRERHPEQSSEWRQGVLSAFRRCREIGGFLLLSPHTPSGLYLIQAAGRLGFPSIVVETCTDHGKKAFDRGAFRSAAACGGTPWPSSGDRRPRLIVEPMAEPSADRRVGGATGGSFPFFLGDGIETSWAQRYPLVDRILIALADWVYGVSVEPGSRTAFLLGKRLDDPRFPPGTVMLDVNPFEAASTKPPREPRRFGERRGKGFRRSHAELHQRGAVLWMRGASRSSSGAELAAARSAFEPRGQRAAVCRQSIGGEKVAGGFPCQVPVIGGSLPWRGNSAEWPFLTHCTRAATGPWPDQSLVAYFDSWLLESESFGETPIAASPLATLVRILTQQRLIATPKLKRAGVPSVSFSEVPLAELLGRRCFQNHLARWDWEPYGICIQRDYLLDRGARRVQYGDEPDWQSLPPQARPLFQLRRSTRGEKQQCWEHEREWRVFDDVRLAEIPFEAAFVFVPSLAEARCLSSVSRFSILCLSTVARPNQGLV